LRDALLLLNKSPGITSFEALRPVKKAVSSRKVGHTGTLDKFASGLLVVLTGRSLKLTPYFTNCEKRYEAVARFGVETDTLDIEGVVNAEAPLPEKCDIEAVLEQFRGKITQIPPVFSAVHVNGKRAHELARGGVSVEMKPRSVTIYDLKLCSYEPPFAKFSVHCSGGTYIRALARDIAVAAGSRAHLVELTRTQVGKFSLSEAFSPPDAADDSRLLEALRPIDRGVFAALGIPVLELDEESAAAVRQGKYSGKNPLLFESPSPRVTTFCGDEFTALFEKRPDGTWRYAFVF
jgi:tRNA pseudouridine55 synthase